MLLIRYPNIFRALRSTTAAIQKRNQSCRIPRHSWNYAISRKSGLRHSRGIISLVMNYSARIEDGDPAMVIEWVAKCEKADLIMMPTRGLGRFRRLLLGSVTSKILHDTSLPLWTSVHKEELSPALPHRCRSILCAAGMNQRDDTVFKAAHLFAGAFDARICLLHIHVPEEVQNQQSLAQFLRHSFDRVCADKQHRLAIDVRVQLLDGGLPQGICQVAREEGVDLLIVGRGHLRESIAQVWSHLYTIIRESPCPVLSV